MSSFRETLPSELSYLYAKAVEDCASFEEQVASGELSPKEVLRAHFCIADYFSREGEGIGGFGPKDIGALLSALGRQYVGLNGQLKWNTVHDKAATLLYGLVMNHPFYDANKRTAYLSTIHYLYANGYIVEVSEKELEDFTVLVAERGLSRFGRYKKLAKKSPDAEVEYISWYLKKNTRRIDHNQYIVTYRELNKILSRYDSFLDNPHGNYIDVMRWEEEVVKRPLFRSPVVEKVARRICVVGFPGWTRQVGKSSLKHVRDALSLNPENGIDAQSFFRDVDDMQVLLEIYEGALRRLADR